MSGLNLQPNFDDPDGFYAALIEHHHDLSAAESEILNTRLVLILANHIGASPVLLEALKIARDSLTPRPDSA